MFIISKGKPKTFNPIRIPTKLAGKTYNPNRPRKYDGHSIRHNRSEILIYKNDKIKGNIFDYIAGAGAEKTNHPATFPKALALDHILTWSNEGDLVLDPMMGSGTVGKMAKLNHRNFIGIEISPEYYKIAERRINNTTENLL
jgi:site-specific DNA-methyltransferase (adenine-specific)